MEEDKKNMTEDEILAAAKAVGFPNAAFMDVKDAVIVPEYRKYCEMNLCGCYNVVPACPPQSGTVEEMTARVLQRKRLLVLQTVHDTDFRNDPTGPKNAKIAHNRMADQLLELLGLSDGVDGDVLRMSAGPWKQNSCMSAYCVDVQKMADLVGMTCWAEDGKTRFFSQILF